MGIRIRRRVVIKDGEYLEDLARWRKFLIEIAKSLTKNEPYAHLTTPVRSIAVHTSYLNTASYPQELVTLVENMKQIGSLYNLPYGSEDDKLHAEVLYSLEIEFAKGVICFLDIYYPLERSSEDLFFLEPAKKIAEEYPYLFSEAELEKIRYI